MSPVWRKTVKCARRRNVRKTVKVAEPSKWRRAAAAAAALPPFPRACCGFETPNLSSCRGARLTPDPPSHVAHFPFPTFALFGFIGRLWSSLARRKRREPSEAICADRALPSYIEAWHAVDVRCRRSCGSWDPVLGRAKANSSSAEPDDDEVECMGESTRAEAEAARVVAGWDVAVDLDAEDEE